MVRSGVEVCVVGSAKPTMPRKLRVEYPSAVYHAMSRGDRREDTFLDDVDRGDDAVDQGDCDAGAVRRLQKRERAAAPVAAGTRSDEMSEKTNHTMG